MKTVDTREINEYSPLIPAIKAICETPKGEELQIIFDNEDAFSDLKKYLREQKTGFREIYEEEKLTLQFITK